MKTDNTKLRSVLHRKMPLFHKIIQETLIEQKIVNCVFSATSTTRNSINQSFGWQPLNFSFANE